MILEPGKIKSATVSTVFPSICHEMMGPDAMIIVFWMFSFKPTFSVFSFKHHSWKALILWQSAFFMVQLSHPYMTTGEIIVLTIWAFVDKMMPLLLNTLSRLVIAFLPRSKHLLISWLQSLSAVMLELKKIKSATVAIFFPIYLPWSDGTGCHDLSFWMLSFKPAFSLLFQPSSRGSLVPLHFVP